MTRPIMVVGVMLSCVTLPAALVIGDAASSYFSNRTTGTIVSNGQSHDYILHVPESYTGEKAVPLVISLHGAMNWPSFQMQLTRWNKAADDYGFIVVYPAGEGGGPKNWSMRGWRTPSRMPDVVFISDLIDMLRQSYSIDPGRIYANGMSAGGGMTFALSCTLSHRIAAFGVVAGAITLPSGWCSDSPPAPMIAFHGTDDRYTPYDGGRVWLAATPFPRIREWTAAWARRNRCAEIPVDSRAAPDVSRREYTNCADDASVILYTFEGGGHTWPGGTRMPEWLVGATPDSVDATRVMWNFFERHRLDARRSRKDR